MNAWGEDLIARGDGFNSFLSVSKDSFLIRAPETQASPHFSLEKKGE